MRKWLVLIFWLSSTAHAGVGVYGGGGLSTGPMNLEQSDISSKFQKFSYFAQGGLLLEFSQSFAIMTGAEYGSSHAYNNVDSTDYLETAESSFSTYRMNFVFSNFMVGGGLRNIDMTVKSVSSSSGAIQKSYKSDLPVYFLSYRFKGEGNRDSYVCSILELQHVTGEIDDLKYQETSLSFSLLINLGL